jgi:hypothetical protein
MAASAPLFEQLNDTLQKGGEELAARVKVHPLWRFSLKSTPFRLRRKGYEWQRNIDAAIWY